MRCGMVLAAALLAACASNQSWRRTPPELPSSPPAIVTPRVERIDPRLLHAPRAGATTAIGLAFRTPAGLDPALVSFTLELVARGPDRAVEEALGEHGGALAVEGLADGALLLAEIEAAAWAPALATIAAAVRVPGFTAADVEELRGERLAAIQRRDTDPIGRGLHALVRRVAPGHDVLGGARAASQWSLEHVRKTHDELWRDGAPALVLVGGAPRAELARAAADALGERGPAPARASLSAASSPRREVLVVPRPGLAQTAIVAGRSVAGDADALALELATAIVASDLREVLRRDRGQTYSVRVTHSPARSGGLLAIETQVEAAATGAALRAMLARLKALQGRFITGDTLRLLGHAFQIERMLAQRGDALAQAIAAMHVQGRPDDALAVELRRLGSVRDDDVERALARWFEPGELHLVLVGDPALISAQVAGLGLGPLTLVDDGIAGPGGA